MKKVRRAAAPGAPVPARIRTPTRAPAAAPDPVSALASQASTAAAALMAKATGGEKVEAKRDFPSLYKERAGDGCHTAPHSVILMPGGCRSRRDQPSSPTSALPVHAIIPMSLLEALRNLDTPVEDGLEELAGEIVSKRLGLSATVAAQITRYQEAARRGTGGSPLTRRSPCSGWPEGGPMLLWSLPTRAGGQRVTPLGQAASRAGRWRRPPPAESVAPLALGWRPRRRGGCSTLHSG